jgi:hypothetical protein
MAANRLANDKSFSSWMSLSRSKLVRSGLTAQTSLMRPVALVARESGFGREGGKEGLYEYVRPAWETAEQIVSEPDQSSSADTSATHDAENMEDFGDTEDFDSSTLPICLRASLISSLVINCS